MDIVSGVLVIAIGLIGIIGAAASKIIADEIKAWLPWITQRFLDLSVLQLPIELQDRFREEWTADVNATPGDLGKLFVASGLLIATRKMCHPPKQRQAYRTSGWKWGVTAAASALIIGTGDPHWVSSVKSYEHSPAVGTLEEFSHGQGVIVTEGKMKLLHPRDYGIVVSDEEFNAKRLYLSAPFITGILARNPLGAELGQFGPGATRSPHSDFNPIGVNVAFQKLIGL